MAETLRALFDSLHAERVRTFSPEDLEANISQRRELEKRFDPAAVKGVGDRLDDFTFDDVTGGRFTLDDLVKDSPAVLILFRFAGCPACNIALPYYQRALWPALSARGIRLAAISPQVPEPLGEIRTTHDLGFTVASDPDNRFAKYLGVTYAPNRGTRDYLARKGTNLRETIGTTDDELPQATALVIDRDRVVRFIDVTPDWLARTEAEPILEAVEALVGQPAE